MIIKIINLNLYYIYGPEISLKNSLRSALNVMHSSVPYFFTLLFLFSTGDALEPIIMNTETKHLTLMVNFLKFLL